MAIDININNQNKHWILVVLSKIKEVFLLLVGFIATCFKFLGRFIKRIWKILVGLAALVMIVIGCIWGYDYYNNVYLPEKLLNEAVADIESKFNSKNDSIKLEYAIHILQSNYSWGYKDVGDESIQDRLAVHHQEAFKYIEDKAYAGNAKYQFSLGQYYYQENNRAKAAYWWNEAAQQGYTKAYNNVGIAYRDGIGVSADIRLAIEWLKKGAEAGEDMAQYNYGSLYAKGVTVPCGTHQETFSTSEYFSDRDRIIKKVWSDSKMTFITYYWEEVVDYQTLIPKDIEKAKYWWKKSASQGNQQAKENLQKIY